MNKKCLAILLAATAISGGAAEASDSFLLSAEIARCGGGGAVVPPEMQTELKEKLSLRALETCGDDAVKLDSDFGFTHARGPGDCEAFQEVFRVEAKFRCVAAPPDGQNS